jgi:23S rRNA pseudouridine1911/1915/1917 synthase
VRPGIVHRIDKDTSGLLVVAKNDEAHLFLSEQIKRHDVSRIYYAIACGNVKNEEGTVNAPIGRSPSDRKKMAIIKDPTKNSKEAITHYTVLERFNGFTFIKCKLETGRTHQIRVHMASLGHALLGDETYGGDKTKFGQSTKSLISGQCLHAGELILTHPRTRQNMHFTCPMPENMISLLEKLRRIQ